MKYFLIIIYSLLLFSCNEITPILKKAEYIEITFYGKLPDRIDNRYYELTIDNPGEVKKISGFVLNKKAPFYKCGYTGSIRFLRKGARENNLIQDAEFNLSTGCTHILFYLKGEIISKMLSPEGLEYLKKLYMKHVKKEHWLIDK